MSTPNLEQQTKGPSFLKGHNVRPGLIAILALLMLIPLAFVGDIVSERSIRYNTVLREISSTWGDTQTLVAPVFVVPYTENIEYEETLTDANGVTRLVSKTMQNDYLAKFLPKNLNIKVNLQDEIRRRGIFETLVYDASIDMSAEFTDLDVGDLAGSNAEFHWDRAWVAIGVSDTRAIGSVGSFVWDDSELTLSPGTQISELPTGFHARVKTAENSGDASQSHRVHMTLNIKGSNAFEFAPLGETSKVAMTSSWPHPSFSGSGLPLSHEISETGFSADWSIPHLARNFPQQWSSKSGNANILEYTAGVSMFEPVTLYSQITRAVKYGILFIGLTFLTLFVFEMAIRQKLHSVQYGLIGFALSLFYLVLLSLSEHASFAFSYLAAAALIVVIISGYTWAVLGRLSRAAIVFGMLSSLYGVLYSLLQLEDYALLMGTLLLVGVVVGLMALTRNMSAKVKLEH